MAGIAGALALTVGRLKRSFHAGAIYVPFYMVARGWWRADARPWLAACAALVVLAVLPRLRRAPVPRPVLWSVLGVQLVALAAALLDVGFGEDPTVVLQAAAVAGAGFAAYVGSVTLDADPRRWLCRVGAAALLLLMGATAWHARGVLDVLAYGASPAVLSRARALNSRLRLPGASLRLGRAEVQSLLESDAVGRASAVTEDLVRTHPDEPELAILRARILERLGDPAALTWLASAAREPLGTEDMEYVARGLVAAGWVSPWAEAWEWMRTAENELFADSSYAFRVAVALRLHGWHRDAMELLSRLHGGVPEGWRAYEIGRIAEDRGNWDEARTWYARSVRDAGAPPDARRRLEQGGELSPSGAVLGEVLRLRSWDVDPTTAAPGESVRVVLVLDVLEFPPEHYRVFLHFEESLHPQQRFYGDHDPLGGARSSTFWLPGEVVEDTSWVVVSPQAARGIYRVWTGLFVPLGSKPRLGDPGQDRISIGWLSVAERSAHSTEGMSHARGF